MSTIFTLKEAVSTATPVLCFEFRFWNGHIERFAAIDCTVEGQPYQRRVLDQNLQDNSFVDEAIGYYSRVALTLSNTDGLLTQLENAHGFRGGELSVRFVFYDAQSRSAVSDPVVLFRGIADTPSHVDESRLVVAAENRFSLFHAKLPGTPIQRRCPWHFPYDAETRGEAATGGSAGRHSMFFRCGYSPDIPGGKGNLDGTLPYTGCNGTREECAARGMLNSDDASHQTRRFGGFTFLPASILVRTHGSRGLQAAEVTANHPRGNDVVPIVYGQGWLTPPLIHSRNDGNLTRMLFLVCDGEVESVERVSVNGVEIPRAVEGRDMTGTGWFKLVASGAREGTFLPKPDNDGYEAESDPHGSMATLEIVIPNALQKGSGLPAVEVLAKGLRLLTFAPDGNSAGIVHTDNPAWVLLDLLLRSGWRPDDLDLPSFASAAAYCAEPIEVGLWTGITQMQPRFSCNLVLQKRRSVGELLRGLREGSFLFVRENLGGKLEAVTESTLAQQQPQKSLFSNAPQAIAGGWPVYEFGDGTESRGGILRSASGAPRFRLFSKPAAECANRIYAEFQDAWNGFQNDKISLFDSREVKRRKHETTLNSRALGLSTYHQAARSVYCSLKRNATGNRFAEFETGLRGIGVRPGDLITITYPKYALDRQTFRVVKVSPSANLETTKIVAQLHDDAWYSDTVLDEIGGLDRYRRPGSLYSTPRPLAGALVAADGASNFDVSEEAQISSDGTYRVLLRCGFIQPSNKISGTLPPPLSFLVASTVPAGGTLSPGQGYCYRFTAVDADGVESAASSPVLVSLPAAGSGYGVQIATLAASAEATEIRVYRGPSSDIVYRIAVLPPSATSFTDTGLEYEAMVPPDSNFDHANFYWRNEIHPAVNASAADSASVVWAPATWSENQFRSKLVWIVSGKGKGQERVIQANNANTLFVEKWAEIPDPGSVFAIADTTWQLGTKTTGTPAQFEVPNTAGSVVQLLGVAANALDLESPADRSVVTRWQIGGGSVLPVDTAVPPSPLFSLGTSSAGDLTLSGIGFPGLENTRTIQSGTLEIFYWDELLDPPSIRLAAAADNLQQTLLFDQDPGVPEGDFLQIEREIVKVLDAPAANTLVVERGAFGTVASPHQTGEIPFRLQKRGMVFAVPLQFFGSDASGAFQQSFSMPHARVAAAQLRFTNAVGVSEAGRLAFTMFADYGLRTGYGGQYALFVEGYLAIEDDAAIPLIVDRDHSVRDVLASLESPATGGDVELDVMLDGSVYCSIVIPQNASFSAPLAGVFLPPIRAGNRLGINVRSVQHSGGTLPGRDLSLRIRV